MYTYIYIYTEREFIIYIERTESYSFKITKLWCLEKSWICTLYYKRIYIIRSYVCKQFVKKKIHSLKRTFSSISFRIYLSVTIWTCHFITEDFYVLQCIKKLALIYLVNWWWLTFIFEWWYFINWSRFSLRILQTTLYHLILL